ncbi:response regulator [Niabella hibiscisoli]|uniref:response regulator n=1 Tax=Niabella hibiscisoli TaxID=1825928 RepID=UPI001F0FFEA4|nr:response regulator [Niabella hibiscisoli]MCH5718512.1 response regulator [Niabella hibiscisoli]
MNRKNYTLAVFDSDKAMLEACALILREQDIDILAFTSSSHFLDQLQSSSPSAILLDNSILPHGGLEVLYLLQQHPTISKIPVIYMTANGTKGDEAIKAGASFLLLKPFDLLQLTETVLQACGISNKN